MEQHVLICTQGGLAPPNGCSAYRYLRGVVSLGLGRYLASPRNERPSGHWQAPEASGSGYMLISFRLANAPARLSDPGI